MSLQQVRKGSSDLLILSILTERPMYGYEIMRELEQRSDGYFTMTAALLYPTLHRLENDSFVTSEWQSEPGTRRRKYYVLTDLGREGLKATQAEWMTFVTKLFETIDKPAPDLGGVPS